jgi:hypothetical protein
VAQPIQDLSALSITDQTVGIGLPRLRCGTMAVSTYNIYHSPDHPSPKRRRIP